MSIIEIMILGIVVNFLVVVLMMIITLLNTMFNMFNPEFMQKFLELEKEAKRLDEVKREIISMKKFPYVQKDFIFLVPFASLIQLFNVTSSLFGHGILFYLYSEIKTKRETLEAKYNINS